MGINKLTLENYVKTEREAFRAAATDAMRQFTPEDRELAASLESTHTGVEDIIKAWTQQIEPVYRDLEDKRLDPKFKKYIVKHIGFHDDQAERIVDHIIDERRASLLDEVLGNLYPESDTSEPYQWQYAHDLLSRGESEVDDFFSRYQTYMDAVDTAEKYTVLLCDPHASWLERQKSALAINKERQRTMHNEDARLDEIAMQLERLTDDPDNLLSKILSMNWNFTTLLDLQAKYEKQVDSLPKSDHKNPTKRLKLFERVTQSFRDSEAEKLAHAHHAHSLKALRTINEEVYNLLLEIFDLHAGDRTRLLHDIERHTRLTQERDMMLLIQRNREHFLTSRD